MYRVLIEYGSYHINSYNFVLVRLLILKSFTFKYVLQEYVSEYETNLVWDTEKEPLEVIPEPETDIA